jgi:lantibiotic modifying enzyme
LFRYIDSVAEKLKHIESLSERALNKSKLMENKRIVALEELRLLEPQIPLLINKTRELQKKVNY